MIIPVPVYEEPEIELTAGELEHARIRAYLDVPNWICPTCGATMFGRCKFCAYCRYRLGRETLKP